MWPDQAHDKHLDMFRTRAVHCLAVGKLKATSFLFEFFIIENFTVLLRIMGPVVQILSHSSVSCPCQNFSVRKTTKSAHSSKSSAQSGKSRKLHCRANADRDGSTAVKEKKANEFGLGDLLGPIGLTLGGSLKKVRCSLNFCCQESELSNHACFNRVAK